MRPSPCLLPCLFLLGLGALRAQGPAPGGDEVTVQYSLSADHALTRAGQPAGALGVHATQVSWRGSSGLSSASRLVLGLSWARFDLALPAATGVPGTLQELSATVGLQHRFNPAWRFTGTLQPGLYGDLAGGNSDAGNVPMLLLATWVRRPELAWSFGLRADWFSERPVIPLVGVNWQFSPGWTFALGLPRTGITYEAGKRLKLSLGVSMQGGNFHVGRDPGAQSSAGPRLDDTLLDYHEIRVGVAADWRLHPALSLTIGAGVITDQKLDYFDRNYTLDGGGMGFLTLSLAGRF